MVDMVALTKMHNDEGSQKRVGRRRAAETRLKLYGIIALLLAAVALVALLGSVFVKAGGALRESYISIPVTFDAAKIDPDGTNDPKKIRRADFSTLTKEALRSAFPTVTDRKQKRALYDLVSSGAAFELADQVADDSSAYIGKTLPYRFLASDVSDLYLKGEFGNLRQTPVEGTLEITLEDDEATLTSSARDFSAALLRVRESLLDDAESLRRKAALQENGVAFYQAALEAAETDERRETLTKQLTSRREARDALLAQAEALEARSKADTGAEDLSDENRSVFINAQGGWFKLTRIDQTQATAEVILPPSAQSSSTTDASKTDEWRLMVSELPEAARKISDHQIIWLESLSDKGEIDSVFNTRFFSSGDSREPELAGIWGAVVGSFWTMLVTFLLAFPIGVLAAIYLEEFAPKNKLTNFIEVNINNLAAVPSIVFGLLGLSVFLGVFGVPRSSPLAGGIVLALMTLPTIIIASRASIRAVPPSIRDAAIGLGASPIQASFHHVLPLAMPGILTGTIIGMAQALGETAPLIMIGMVAFIVDIPGGITDSASVLPVQVFRWSDFPERAFEARTAAAICVLLLFLVVMNAIAVFLRKRFERRW